MSQSEAQGGTKPGAVPRQWVELEDERIPIGHRTPLWHTRWYDSGDDGREREREREFVVADYFRKPSMLQRLGVWLRAVWRER